MSGKTKHPCANCGRGIATHRSMSRTCSESCLKEARNWRRYADGLKRKAKTDSKAPQAAR